MNRFDVLTIGNAIVDVLARVDDEFLKLEGLNKSIMHLIDEPRAEYLYDMLPDDKQQVSGGSSANTVAGVASLGGRGAFIGKVAGDPLGDFFEHDMKRGGVHYSTSRLTEGPATARSMIMVTPDGERTMNTFLGACQELTEADIEEEMIAEAGITYMEGYLWDPPSAKKAFVLAAHYAHKYERATALTLSDPFCVNRYREEFLDLMRSRTVDYVFANIDELKALYETDNVHNAVHQVTEDAEIAAVTLGEEGAMVVSGGEIVTVPAFPVDKVEDVTGAGDQFAAGFLLGISRGQDLGEALRAGCLAASEVISHVGARPLTSLRDLADDHGLAV